MDHLPLPLVPRRLFHCSMDEGYAGGHRISRWIVAVVQRRGICGRLQLITFVGAFAGDQYWRRSVHREAQYSIRWRQHRIRRVLSVRRQGFRNLVRRGASMPTCQCPSTAKTARPLARGRDYLDACRCSGPSGRGSPSTPIAQLRFVWSKANGKPIRVRYLAAAKPKYIRRAGLPLLKGPALALCSICLFATLRVVYSNMPPKHLFYGIKRIHEFSKLNDFLVSKS